MNNWLRLPQVWLDNDKDYLLTFYVDDSFAYQYVDVYLYGSKCYDGNVTPEDLDGDGIPEYFSKVLTEEIAVVGKVSGWHEVKVDLSDYAGQYVYAAIVQQGGEGEMRVDDIALWQRPAHTPDGERTIVFFNGFENSDKELPEGWDTLDKDGDSYNWNACFGGSDKIHHGKGGVYSSSYGYGKALTPDNWLVMPSHTVSTTKKTTLTFEAVGSHYKDYNEVFGVFISVDGGEFEQIGKDYTANYAWQEVEVDLTPYAGKSVRVAVVHHNCTDQESLFLDCFNIWEEPFPPIETADVTVDIPMVGETVPTTNAEAIKINIDSYDISARAYTFQWRKTSKESYETEKTPTYTTVTNGETFSVDYVYRLVARFTLDECYTFADNLKMTVNGIADYYDAEYEIKGDGNILDVSIIFYPLEAYITDVAVTVTEPVVGAVPDIAPTVVTTPDKTFEYFAGWAKALKEDYTTLTETDWEPIKSPTETFAEGYVYAVCFGMGTDVLPQYEFSPDVTVSINGKPALKMIERYCYSPSELYAYAVFDLSSTKPQNVKATAGDGQVTLTWDAVPGASKYSAYTYLDGKFSLIGITTNTTITATGLTNGTKYGFLVLACVGGTWTKTDTANVVYATPVASVPSPKFTVTPGDGQAVISWTAVTGASKYSAYYYLDSKFYSIGVTTATTITAKGLTNGTKYGFLVLACVDGKWTKTDTANVVYATPSAGVPSPKFTVTAGDGQAVINWTAVTGASKYSAYYYLGGKFYSIGVTTATTITAKGLTNGTKYGFLVLACVDGKWTKTDTANVVYATPSAGVPSPKFTVTAGDGQAVINWTAVTGASKYSAYYYLGGKFYSIGITTATTITAKGLTNGTKYGFLVLACVDGKWTKTDTANVVYATPSAGVPSPEFTVTAGDGQATISWTAVTGATKYSAYTYLDSKFSLIGVTTATTITATGLTNGTKYGFIVLACVDGKWTKTDTANIVYATPSAGVPSPKFTVTPGNGQAVINWTAVTGATKYSAYTYLDGKFSLIGVTTATTITAKSLTNGTKYGFIVLACVDGKWTKTDTANIIYATPNA